MQISAQFSLYPLRQERLSPAIEEAWKILEDNQLDLEKGAMSTVVNGEGEKVFGAIKQVFIRCVEKGPIALVATFSNACAVSSSNNPQVPLSKGKR